MPYPAPQPLINGGSPQEEGDEDDSDEEGEGVAAVAAAAASLEEEAEAAAAESNGGLSALSAPAVVGGAGAKSDPATATEGVPGS